MNIERATVSMLTITNAPNLDPVRVVVENSEPPGRGRVIIQCYDRAWTGAWGAMGSALEPFFIEADPEYIASNLTCGLHGMTKIMQKADAPYLRRIIETVQTAFKEAAATQQGESNV